MRNVILVGPPGAGKGTQAKRLERCIRLPHIASGDLLRDIRRQDTALAQEVKEFMDRGEYVPDELMNELVLERLNAPDARTGFLLDGFPRTQAQAEALDEAMGGKGRKLERVVYITCPTDILEKRIADRIICMQCHAIYNHVTKPPKQDSVCDDCGYGLERRTDQEPDVIRRRLTEYIRQTQPLIAYYKNKGLLIEVDGARPIAAVKTDIDAAIGLQGVS